MHNKKKIYISTVKPFFDFVFAVSGLIVFSPLFLLIFFLLAFTNKGHVFFIQKRPGKAEKIFSLIKFKTMNDKKDAKGNLLPDAERLTASGKIIRKTSFDELPQLINILKGEMSLIGPRPLLTEYLHLYSTAQKLRHTVKPGITGWAQVNGRNAITWKQKLDMDVYYVNNISYMLDIKIILLTVLKVFKGEGINEANSTSVKKFTGNN